VVAMSYISYVITVVLVVHSSAVCSAPFAYDRAAYAAQKGDWKKSAEMLNVLVNDHPDNPEIIYDAGVAAYKQGQFEQAQAYFVNAAHACQQHQNILKEQAYFNLGNTHVQLNKLEVAVEDYKQALELNPNNEHTKHNLEIVLKMLEQKKQQKQQQNKDNKKDQDQKKQGQQDQQKQQNKQDQKDSDNQQDKQNQKQQSDQKNEQKNDTSDQQKQNQQQKKQQQDGNDQRQKEEEQRKAEKERQEQKQQTEQQAAKKEKNEQQEGKPVEQGQQAGKLNMQLAQILNECEKKDAHLNKQTIRATVKNNMMGQQGENCW
jgi:Ca-activated chloride channel family protein